VATVNVSNAKFANLQESVTEPYVVSSQLALEGVQLAQAAARAGTRVNGAIVAPNICKARGSNMTQAAETQLCKSIAFHLKKMQQP
jgi:hypothetical protein